MALPEKVICWLGFRHISNKQETVVLEGFQGDRFLLIAQPGLPVKWVDSKRLACYNTIKFDRAGDAYGTAL